MNGERGPKSNINCLKHRPDLLRHELKNQVYSNDRADRSLGSTIGITNGRKLYELGKVQSVTVNPRFKTTLKLRTLHY